LNKEFKKVPVSVAGTFFGRERFLVLPVWKTKYIIDDTNEHRKEEGQ